MILSQSQTWRHLSQGCSRILWPGLLLSALVLAQSGPSAPGAPGEPATWTNGNKEGVGTSATLASKVWFTLREGVMSETYYPAVDVANTRSLMFAVSDGRTFAMAEDDPSFVRQLVVTNPRALSFRQINRDGRGRFTIAKSYTVNPEFSTILIDVDFQSHTGRDYQLYVIYDPSMANSGLHDTAAAYGGQGAFIAYEGDQVAALISNTGFAEMSAGFLGTSDGWADLKKNFKLTQAYARAEDGNVVCVARIKRPANQAAGRGTLHCTLALAFADEVDKALGEAEHCLETDFAETQAAYEKGWMDWLATLRHASPRYERQFNLAAMTLKAHEDKTHRGAMIASLTIPWGDTTNANEPNIGGYHLVWSRDLYQVATAFMALGDQEAAKRALDYLFTVQQKPDGSFPQNSWLDGRPYWPSLQMDEVAFPLILAYQLGRTDQATYAQHVKQAADFIVAKGPATPQERWEEEEGYSPSTIAAEIAGLVCAAEIAKLNGDQASAQKYLSVADDWAKNVERWTATTTGKYGDGSYYLRINDNQDPNDGHKLEINNGGGTWDEREVVDAGFLELVRLGIKRPDDPLVAKSLRVVDRVIKVMTPKGPAWYRYNHDAYGEKADGTGWRGTGVGRLWPILTGERGEYEIANGRSAALYLEAMTRLANAGGMIPEQVWDRPASPRVRWRFGEGTGSATPLAWSLAQFIRLAVSAEQRRVIEMPEVVAARYARRNQSILPHAPSKGVAKRRPPR